MKSRREGGGFAARLPTENLIPLPRLEVAIPARLYDGGGAVRPGCSHRLTEGPFVPDTFTGGGGSYLASVHAHPSTTWVVQGFIHSLLMKEMINGRVKAIWSCDGLAEGATRGGLVSVSVTRPRRWAFRRFRGRRAAASE